MKKEDNDLLLGAGAAIAIGLLGMAISKPKSEASTGISEPVKPCGCNKH